MKKIALISASVLALGAASIAADADGVSMLNDENQASVLEFTTTASAESAASAVRGARLSQSDIERSVRAVSSLAGSVDSCDAANWPYYPSECLTRVQTTDL